MSVGQLLAELGLEEFEAAICCRLGATPLEEIGSLRYEELLEMGLSKVQCHLFLTKASAFAKPDSTAASLAAAVVDADGFLHFAEASDGEAAAQAAAAAEAAESGDADGEHGDGGKGWPPPPSDDWASQVRAVALRQLMPPPLGIGSPAPGAAHSSSRKRARSYNPSSAAARGSEHEHLSTAGSASGDSSSSSLHMEIPVKKRRVLDRRQRSGGDRGPPSTHFSPAGTWPPGDDRSLGGQRSGPSSLRSLGGGGATGGGGDRCGPTTPSIRSADRPLVSDPGEGHSCSL